VLLALNGHMDAIYFGNLCWFGSCAGTSPLVEADMENGLFAGGNGPDPGNKGNGSPFVTAMLKNNGTTTYALKDGNASDGSFFEGVITAGYPSTGTGDAVQANIVAAGYQQLPRTFPAVSTPYTITSVSSGTVLDSVDCGIFDGTLTDLWSPLGNTCQEWDLTS
jgi:hypothetical protein